MRWPIDIQFSTHAVERSELRNVTQEEMLFVMAHGEKCRNAGVLMYFLRQCDIPPSTPVNGRIAQLVHTAVLVNEETGDVITVYRNRNALKEHRRKQKHNLCKRAV